MKLLPLALLAVATLARAESQPAKPAVPAPATSPATASGGKTTVTVRQSPPDDFTAAVVGYPMTMSRLETYAAAVHELRLAAERDPKLLADLRASGARNASVAEASARLDGQPKVKAVLDRHGLAGRDLVLAPVVMQATGVALFAEQSGHAMPADRTNAACMAMYRADRAKVEQVYAAVKADLRTFGGP